MRTTIGPYRVIDFIGAGGMGEVYRVVHRTIGRVAAAKILTAAGPSPSAAERFRNEARIHSTVQHPRIATMYEYLEVDGLPCIVMELVEGVTLEQYIHQRG